MHVHDDDRAGVVAHHKLVWVLREGNHIVDGHLRRSRQRLVRVEALPRLGIPNLQRDIPTLTIGAADTTETRRASLLSPYLHGAVSRCTDDVKAVGGEKRIVYKRQVSRQLLHRLSRSQLVYSEEDSESGAQEFTNRTHLQRLRGHHARQVLHFLSARRW